MTKFWCDKKDGMKIQYEDYQFSIIQNFSLQKLTIALCKSHDRGNSAGAVGPQIAIFKVTFRFQTLKMNHRIRKFKIHGEQLKILHI